MVLDKSSLYSTLIRFLIARDVLEAKQQLLSPVLPWDQDQGMHRFCDYNREHLSDDGHGHSCLER
jgi:hypothetical protein